MDPEWMAVVGAAIGAVGGAGAAIITGWSTRRQAAKQALSQEEQWRREKRQEAYAEFLKAGAEARDTLAAIWRTVIAPGVDYQLASSQLKDTRPHIQKVQLASAVVFVVGPENILVPTRSAEEGVVLFYKLLQSTVEDIREGKSAREKLRICSSQYDHVHVALERFAASSRSQLNGVVADGEPLPPIPEEDATEELAWLLTHISELGGVSKDAIDTTESLFLYGFNSLSVLILLSRWHRYVGAPEGRVSVRDVFEMSSIEVLARYLANQRRAAFTQYQYELTE